MTTLFAFGGIYATATFGLGEDLLLFGIAMNVTAGLGAAAFGWLDDGRTEANHPHRGRGIARAGLGDSRGRQQGGVLGGGAAAGVFVGPAQAAGRRSWRTRRRPPCGRDVRLYALAGKATNFLGPAVLAWVTAATASPRAGMASILVFFVLGAGLLLPVPDPRGSVAPPPGKD